MWFQNRTEKKVGEKMCHSFCCHSTLHITVSLIMIKCDGNSLKAKLDFNKWLSSNMQILEHVIEYDS